MDLLYFLLTGAVAGWLAGLVMKGGGFGLVGNIVVGILGGVLGGWLFPLAGLELGGALGLIVTAAGGAIVLLFVIGLLKKGK